MTETDQGAQEKQPIEQSQRIQRDINMSSSVHFSPSIREAIARHERAEQEAKQRRRLALASTFEILVFILLAAGAFIVEYRVNSFGGAQQELAIIKTAISPFFLFLCATVVLEMFLLILNGRTVIVGTILAFQAAPLDAGFGSVAKFADAFSRALLGVKFDIGPASRGATTEDVAAAAASMENKDPVIVQFERNIERSTEAVSVAQRRPNALLFIGTVVAGVGLVFFLVTLPGFITTFDAGTVEASDLWRRLLDLIPRLLMLVFIQLLAGFFLQKYRSAMEEFRYYEALLRQREEQLASYVILKTAGENSSLQTFAREIMEHRNLMKIASGETTLVADAHGNEVNQFAGSLKEILDFMKSNRAINGVDAAPNR